MTIAFIWRLSISINVNMRSMFDNIGSAIQELIATFAAKRTTAKFLFACGILLITILVMLARVL